MNAFIVAAKRSAVGKSKKGGLRFFRPDDLAATVIKGMINDLGDFDKELIEKSIDFSAGDLFLFYTDGITEARDNLKVEFGEERLGKIVAGNAHLSANDFKEKVVINLNQFVQKALLDDDATLIVIKT